MKKHFAFITAAALCALSFTACASAPASSSTPPVSSAPPVASSSSQTSSSAPSGDFGDYVELDVGGDDTRVVVFGSDEVSFQVVSTLIIRNQNALLVDTKFTKTDAQEIINYLQSSGINLTQIFISHGDPDYYFGLEEFTEAYPSAVVSTTPSVAEHIAGTYEDKLVTWAEALGDEIPTNITIPQNLTDTGFEFEGLEVQIFGSEPTRITLYIPELSMVLGGANITSGNHLFLADMSLESDRQLWLNNLTELRDLNASTVIPGHSDLTRETFDRQAIDFSMEYLQAAEETLRTTQNSEEFIAVMGERFPNLRSASVLGLSAAVLNGEMEWERYADN